MSSSYGLESLLFAPLVGGDVGVVEAFALGGDFAGVCGREDGVAGRDPGIVDVVDSFSPFEAC